MTTLNWSDDLSTGNRMIDDDHRHLITLAGTLADALNSGKGNGALKAILDELISDTASHFEREEKLMQQIGYWAYLPHKADHEALIGEIVALRKRFDAGTLAISSKVYFFLTEWLGTHTRTSDRLLAAAVRKAADAAVAAAGMRSS